MECNHLPATLKVPLKYQELKEAPHSFWNSFVFSVQTPYFRDLHGESADCWRESDGYIILEDRALSKGKSGTSVAASVRPFSYGIAFSFFAVATRILREKLEILSNVIVFSSEVLTSILFGNKKFSIRNSVPVKSWKKSEMRPPKNTNIKFVNSQYRGSDGFSYGREVLIPKHLQSAYVHA